MKKIFGLIPFVLIFQLLGCSPPNATVLRLATTTSTDDSGLLDAILPVFEQQKNIQINVIAVGTGQAIALGEAGDVDIVLVHDRQSEDAFVEAGHGIERFDVMYNDFVIVGPKQDPAGIQGMLTAQEAFAAIAAAESTFASRGDDSGTHSKELKIWDTLDITPIFSSGWYKSIGQGMGDTLLFAEELGAYTLTDRGTYLASQQNLPNLAVMVGGENIDENGDSELNNPYSLITVNPDKGNINYALAQDFVIWLTSPETQRAIAHFGAEKFGQPLFYPESEAWKIQ